MNNNLEKARVHYPIGTVCETRNGDAFTVNGEVFDDGLGIDCHSTYLVFANHSKKWAPVISHPEGYTIKPGQLISSELYLGNENILFVFDELIDVDIAYKEAWFIETGYRHAKGRIDVGSLYSIRPATAAEIAQYYKPEAVKVEGKNGVSVELKEDFKRWIITEGKANIIVKIKNGVWGIGRPNADVTFEELAANIDDHIACLQAAKKLMEDNKI